MEKRITLRAFDRTEADIDAIMSWAGDSRVTRFQRREPFTRRAEALHFLETHILPHPYYRAICLDDHRIAVGSVTVTPCAGEGNSCRASLGYRMAFEHWGRGIATAAVRLVVGEVFEKWEGLERVEAVVDVENVGSQRVLEKAGFVREGVLRRYLVLKGEVRDMVMFSLVPADFSSVSS